MPNLRPEDELLRAALTRGPECPPVEQLEKLLERNAPAALQQHVHQCAHCQTELHMLRAFLSNEPAAQDVDAVAAIAANLKARSAEIFPRRAMPEATREPWWRNLLAVRWLSPVAAAAAVLLVAAGITIQLRQRQPALESPAGGQEVLRSAAIAVLSPTGDLSEKPHEIRWDAVANAARYSVRVMEVDRAPVWNVDTTDTQVQLPPNVQAVIVPAKTLLVQVTALDAEGRKIAESETVRFRLLQKLYSR